MQEGKKGPSSKSKQINKYSMPTLYDSSFLRIRDKAVVKIAAFYLYSDSLNCGTNVLYRIFIAL